MRSGRMSKYKKIVAEFGGPPVGEVFVEAGAAGHSQEGPVRKGAKI